MLMRRGPRLVSFFQLTGRIVRQAATVQVELCPFNDRQLNRDLAVICARVNAASPCIPDGHHLLLTVCTGECRNLATREHVAI